MTSLLIDNLAQYASPVALAPARGSALREVIVRPNGFQEMKLSPIARFDLARGTVAVIGRGDNR